MSSAALARLTGWTVAQVNIDATTVQAMRDWVADCDWQETPERIAELSDRAIVAGIERNYDGGVRGVVRDCAQHLGPFEVAAEYAAATRGRLQAQAYHDVHGGAVDAKTWAAEHRAAGLFLAMLERAGADERDHAILWQRAEPGCSLASLTRAERERTTP
jgi:hypothetical protein